MKAFPTLLFLMLCAICPQAAVAQHTPTPAETRAQYEKLDADTQRELDGGHAQAAYESAEKELSYALRWFDPKGREAENALEAVSVTAFATSHYARALEAVNGALAIDDPTGTSTSDNVADGRLIAATVLTMQQRFPEAERQLRDVLDTETLAGRTSSEQYVVAEISLATNAALTARFEEAQKILGEALQRARTLRPPNHGYEVLALANRAQFSVMQGRYPEARAQFSEAIAHSGVLDPQADTVDLAALARLYDNLALLDKIQGHFSDADNDFSKSAALLAAHPGVLPSDEVALANGRAMLHAFEGRPDVEAEIERVLTQAQSIGPQTALYATVLDNGGLIDMQQGRLERARTRLEQSVDIEAAIYGPIFADLVAPLLNLSQIALYQNDLSGARTLLERAQTIVNGAAVQPTVAVGVTLAAARLAQLKGAFSQAEALTARAGTLAESALGATHPLLSGVYLQMGDVLFSEGLPARATRAYADSVAVLHEQYAHEFPTMSERERLDFYSGADGVAAHAFSFGLKYRNDPQVAGDTYDLAMQQKNYVGAGIEALRARIAASNDGGAAQTLERLVELRARIAALEYATIEPEARRQALADLQRQAEGAEAQLLARYPSSVQPPPTSWRDVRRALRAGEAAVEIFRFRGWNGLHDDRSVDYAAAVVTPAASAPRIVELADGKTMEGPALASYRQQTGLSRYDGSTAATTLYDAFWKPLERALEGAHRIYLAPAGVIAQIAPATIELPDHRFVADAYDVRVVASTRDLLRAKRTFTEKTAQLFGAPDFNARNGGAAGSGGANGERARAIAGCGGPLSDLPESRDEVEGIAKLLQSEGWRSQTHVGPQATKNALEVLAAPRVLHLATHGIFIADAADTGLAPVAAQSAPRPGAAQVDAKAPNAAGAVQAAAPSFFDAQCHPHDPMFRSLLFFAGANRTWVSGELSEEDDGILTASELAGLDLRSTEIVVLSACDSGLGSGPAGEGVLGLRRALEQAGAQSVLMSMWPVSSTMTRDLMTAFYAHWLAGMDKHDALRAAQKDLREQEGAGPSEWGAFVLVGGG